MAGRAKKAARGIRLVATTGEVPLYRAIYDELRGELHEGRWRPGDRLPSEAALCERFGASRITVARALLTLQQECLVIRRPGSGTYVTEPAAGPESMRFGLLIPDLGTTDIFEPICQGMMRSPLAKAHSLTWGPTTSHETDRESAAVELCRHYIEQRVAGVFFAPMEFMEGMDGVNRRLLKMLETAGMPVVLLDRCVEPFPGRSRFDLVGIDNYRVGYLLASHLLEAGARRIVFAARVNSASTVEQRLAGYREALRAGGMGEGRLVTGRFEDAGLVRSMLEEERPDALLCANDVTAAEVMRTMLTLGVRIPEEIRMVGVDDVRYARYLPVPLTTVRQSCAEIGEVAMVTMLDRIRRPELPARDVLVRTELVVRRSSGFRDDLQRDART